MSDDLETSKLISQSLSGQLDSEHQRQMAKRVAEDPQSRRFARISRLIQDSVSDFAQRVTEGDETVVPGLKQSSKLKMKERLRAESARQSQVNLGATVTSEDAAISTLSGAREISFDPTNPEVREMTSRFSLIKELGHGGLGTVWLARDEKLKRSVALKEMHPEAAEFPRAWERFHREAQITGHLEHPNVVPMYQFGTDAKTGAPFYAMRFVGKRTLVDAIDEYHDRKANGDDVTMDLHRLLSAFIGVCQAIAYAHSRGVVHRDLKPENVALDNFGQVIVLDWGLARISDEFEAESILSGDPVATDSVLGKTLAGEVIGTPLYMAPEQAAGQLDRVDERTDVYGLGAVLFAMLTGVAPHQNSSMKDGASLPVAEMLERVANEATPRVRDLVADVPSDLEEICARAMNFKPHSRYQSVAELSDAVQMWMAGRSKRRQDYANCRSEGRELRTALQSAVRDLERNVRFISSLPPIQGIIGIRNGRSDDNLKTWRERLRVIFEGLMRTNCDFASVGFAEVKDNEFHELLRVERQKSDRSNIRSIPGSRLVSGPLTTCMTKALAGHPDEVNIALSSECPKERQVLQDNLLAAGVPVFDEETEELFGFVMIQSCLERLIEDQVRTRLTSVGRLYVLDNECQVLLQFERGGIRVRENEGKAMSCVTDSWAAVLESLKGRGEFVDEHDHSVYGTRIDLVPGKYSLALVMCLSEHKAN